MRLAALGRLHRLHCLHLPPFQMNPLSASMLQMRLSKFGVQQTDQVRALIIIEFEPTWQVMCLGEPVVVQRSSSHDLGAETRV